MARSLQNLLKQSVHIWSQRSAQSGARLCSYAVPFLRSSHRVSSLQQTRLSSNEAEEEDEVESVEGEGEKESSGKYEKYNPVDVEKSIKYMESEAYSITYNDQPVWYYYRANHPYSRPKRKTRKTCVRGGVITTGNPCPICRDEYLVIDHRNIKLLKQFLTPNELHIYKPARTQICMKQYKKLKVALEKAKEVGLLEDRKLEFRHYDYSQYYDELKVRPEGENRRRDDTFVRKVLEKSKAEQK